MKTKFFFLLAALLLISTGAFAQNVNSEPLKGDVNEDGKVDVADINAIIKIMKDAGGTAEAPVYYWYVGTTKPTSLSDASTVTSYPAEHIYTNNSGAKSKIYALTDTNHNITFYNPQFNTELGQMDVDIITIPGYKIYETEGRTGNTGTIKLVIYHI